MYFNQVCGILLALLLATSGCSDSKTNLETGKYSVSSDCRQPAAAGEVTVSEESPNVFLAAGVTEFGFPSERIQSLSSAERGRLESSGDERVCTSLARSFEPELFFVCFVPGTEHVECVVKLTRQ